MNGDQLQKLPILVIHAAPPKYRGGVKRFADELINGLHSNGVDVHILLGKQNKSLLSNLFLIFKEYLKYLRIIDLVHFIVLSPYDVPFIILAKIYGKKIVSTYHGIYNEESSIMKEPHIFIPFWVSDKIYRKCSNMIVSPNSYLLQKLKILKNTNIIHNPFNSTSSEFTSSSMAKPSHEIVFITASNFDIKKKSDAISYLLNSMDVIAKNHDNVKLLVFGEGVYLDALKTRYGNKKNIVFMGFRKDFRQFLIDSDAYLHVSGLDVQPYSVIEAMMLGKVILYNDIGSLVEMIDRTNNYVVSLEIKSITNGMMSLINELQNNNDSFRNKGIQNRKFAMEHFSTEIIAKKYLSLYREILNKD